MHDATRVGVSHITARPYHSRHSKFTPTHAWQPPGPNQLPADFLNPNYTHTGMPPAIDFRGPMDAPIAPEYNAEQQGTQVLSQPVYTRQQRELVNTLHATARVRTGNGYQEFPGWHPARHIGAIAPYATEMIMPVGTTITSGSGLSHGIVAQLEAIHSTQQQTHFRDATRQARRQNQTLPQQRDPRPRPRQRDVPEAAHDAFGVQSFVWC